MPYVYNAQERRYRDTQTGRYVSGARVREAARQIVDTGNSQADALTDLLVSGQLSPEDWSVEFRETLKRRAVSNYMLGRGGRNAMQASDYGRVGAYLRQQYKLVDGFLVDIRAGGLSEAQIRARSRQYFNATRTLYERGNAAAYGLANVLPAYPGQQPCTTDCCAGCQCYWDIQPANLGNPDEEDWDCYWRLGSAEHCPQCERRSVAWSPLKVRGGKVQPYRRAGLFRED